MVPERIKAGTLLGTFEDDGTVERRPIHSDLDLESLGSGQPKMFSISPSPHFKLGRSSATQRHDLRKTLEKRQQFQEPRQHQQTGSHSEYSECLV